MAKVGRALRRGAPWLVGLGLAAGMLGWWSHRSPAPTATGAQDLAAVLRAWDRETEGAFPPAGHENGDLSFPRDHGAHRDRPFEIWETVVRLQGEAAPRWLRFRVTRLAAAPDPPARASAWAANEFIRGDLMLSDTPGAAGSTFVRSSRVALGIAGHRNDPPRIWIDGNSLAWASDRGRPDALTVGLRETGVTGTLRFDLAAPRAGSAASGFGDGLWAGYLFPRLRVSGEITTGRAKQVVDGSGWLLHNWGALPPVGGQVTFDRWFVQFDQGFELGVVQTRRRDGSAPPTQRGFWVASDARVEALDPAGLRLEPAARQGGRPQAWRLSTADGRTRVRLEAAAGEAGTAGGGEGGAAAVRAEGIRDGRPVTGWGMVELGAP